MMAEHNLPSTLIERMPTVRGRITANEPMARYTWFKVGGPAEVFFRPADEQDLAEFLQEISDDVPIFILGNASNLIVRDGGIEGVVIRLGSAFSQISIEGLDISAGAGAADQIVSRRACDGGIAGLEFLSGIPGTLGGAVVMNGGAYGSDVSEICTSVRCVDRSGQIHECAANTLGFSYRHSKIDPNWIITDVRLRGIAGDKTEISKRMEAIQSERGVTQPVKTLTGGSTFANPDNHKAWQLIDQAGCRGLKCGGAMVSELHCNFLINTGDATAQDIETLGEEVRRRVFERSGVRLEWEVRRVGQPIDRDIRGVTA
jgi:UDP-N-acetylmuramate dehydrogenase